MAQNFEDCRKRWLRADEELVSCKDMLTKVETETAALEVKLKHARNQVDVEIRRRQKAEMIYEKLVRVFMGYMGLLCFVLFYIITDTFCDVCLLVLSS